MTLKLIIGTKTYSSWSLRPWIAMVEGGIPFSEQVITLRKSETASEIAAYSPGKKVPVLLDGDIVVWETIAILEYLAERHPQVGLWPGDEAARAHARAISAEMHAGFSALRGHCPMNFRRTPRARKHTPPEVLADVERVAAIWREARKAFGAGGPFLFGAHFGAADAMFAPVVHRLHAYDFKVPADTRAYMEAVMATKAWKRWSREALAEPADWIWPDTYE